MHSLLPTPAAVDQNKSEPVLPSSFADLYDETPPTAPPITAPAIAPTTSAVRIKLPDGSE